MESKNRTPKAIAKIKGNYRPCRHEDELTPLMEEVMSVPQSPEMLNDDGIFFWREQLKKLLKIDGLMTENDLPMFEQLAFVYGKLRELSLLIKSQPDIIESFGRPRVNPYWNIYHELLRQFIVLSREYGLTPAARTRIKLMNNAKTINFNDLKI